MEKKIQSSLKVFEVLFILILTTSGFKQTIWRQGNYTVVALMHNADGLITFHCLALLKDNVNGRINNNLHLRHMQLVFYARSMTFL